MALSAKNYDLSDPDIYQAYKQVLAEEKGYDLSDPDVNQALDEVLAGEMQANKAAAEPDTEPRPWLEQAKESIQNIPETATRTAHGLYDAALYGIPEMAGRAKEAIFDKNPMSEDDWADRMIERSRAHYAADSQNQGGDGQALPSVPWLLPEGVKQSDITASMQSAPFSAVGMAGGLVGRGLGMAAGALGGAAATPELAGAGAAPGVVAGGAAGAIAGSALALTPVAKNSIERELLFKFQEANGGVRPTEEQAAALLADFDSSIKKHVAGEVLPEAVGNAFEIGFLAKMIGKTPAGQGVLKQLASKAFEGLKSLGMEVGTETVTGMVQQPEEVAMGLRPGEAPRSMASLQDWETTRKEVTPQTLILQGGMSIGGSAIGMLRSEEKAKEQIDKIGSATNVDEAIAAATQALDAEPVADEWTPETQDALLAQATELTGGEDAESLRGDEGQVQAGGAPGSSSEIPGSQDLQQQIAAGAEASDTEEQISDVEWQLQELEAGISKTLEQAKFADDNGMITRGNLLRQRVGLMRAKAEELRRPAEEEKAARRAQFEQQRGSIPSSAMQSAEVFAEAEPSEAMLTAEREADIKAAADASRKTRAMDLEIAFGEDKTPPKQSPESLELLKNDPVYAAVAAARRTPLDLNALERDYPELAKEITKKFPAIVTRKNGKPADEFATDNGFESLDKFVEAIKAAKPISQADLDQLAGDTTSADLARYDKLAKDVEDRSYQLAKARATNANPVTIRKIKRDLAAATEQLRVLEESYPDYSPGQTGEDLDHGQREGTDSIVGVATPSTEQRTLKSSIKQGAPAPGATPAQPSQFSAEVIKQQLPFAKNVEAAQDGHIVTFENGTRLKIANNQDIEIDLASASKAYRQKFNKGEVFAAGSWQRVGNLKGLVRLDFRADLTDMHHELFHAAFEMVLTPVERKALLKKYGSEENAAKAYGEYAATGKGPTTFQKIANFLKSLFGFISTPERVAQLTIEQIRQGAVWKRGVSPQVLGAVEDGAPAPGPQYSARLHPQIVAARKKKDAAILKEQGASKEFIAAEVARLEKRRQMHDDFIALLKVKDITQYFPISVSKESTLRSNVDYVKSADMSSNCTRRLDYNATMEALAKNIGRPLTANEYIYCAKQFYEAGHLAPCLFCYVESMRSAAMNSLRVAMEEMNATFDQDAAGKKLIDSAFFHDADVRYQVMNKVDGFEDHPYWSDKETYDYLWKKYNGVNVNQTKPYSEYSGEVLRLDKRAVAKMNKDWGMRMLSTSDFQIEHVVDFAQLVTDMNIRGLAGHFYTKEEGAARFMGQTGVKVSLSVTLKWDKAANQWVDLYSKVGGMDIQLAQELAQDPRYSANTGIIAVLGDDTSITKALDSYAADPLKAIAHYIIPFHASGASMARYQMYGFEQDYTNQQNHGWLVLDNPKKAQATMLPLGTDKGTTMSVGELNQWVIKEMDSYLASVGSKVRVKVREELPVYQGGDKKKIGKVPRPSVHPSDYTDPWVDRSDAKRKQDYIEYCAKEGIRPVFWKWISHPAYFNLVKYYAKTDTALKVLDDTKLDYDYAQKALDKWVAEGAKIGGHVNQEMIEKLTPEILGGDADYLGSVAAAKEQQGLVGFPEEDAQVEDDEFEDIPVQKKAAKPKAKAKAAKKGEKKFSIKAQPGSGSTQIAGTTKMYRKAVQKMLALLPGAKTVLDYGAGLGLGTDAMRDEAPGVEVDSLEVNPERWQGKTPPTYTDSSQINKKYDAIINTNVLNVLEPELRGLVLKDIGDKLAPGGKAMITTRGWKDDVETNKNFRPADEPKAMWVKKVSGGKEYEVYQKGFDGNELVDYASKTLGAGFSVNKIAGFGKSGVIVTKYSLKKAGEPEFSPVDTTSTNFKKWFKNSKVVDEDGEPLVVYHATTHDFEAFNKSNSNPENDMGKGFYFTTTTEDASENYAGEGPDLTLRIETAVDRIKDDIYNDPEEFGLSEDDIDDDKIVEDKAYELARQQLKGPHEGAIVPAYLSFQNPVELGGDNPTELTYESEYDEETEEYGEPTGTLVEFADALRDILEERSTLMPQQIDEIIYRLFEDGEGISAEDAINRLRTTDLAYAEDTNDDYALSGNEFIRQAFEDAGFDGIIDRTVDIKFGSQKRIGKKMAGMAPDTVHYIAFKPTQIKSAVSNTGEFSKTDPRVNYSLKSAAPFYSRTLRAVEENFPESMKAQKVIAYLKSQLKDTKEQRPYQELEALGLKEWLDAKNPADIVSREDLVNFVKANTTKLEDVVLGERKTGDSVSLQKEYREITKRMRELSNSGQSPLQYLDEWERLEKRKSEINREIDAIDNERNTHFSKYTEPGAVKGSYREMFVTAPSDKQNVPKGWGVRDEGGGEWSYYGPGVSSKLYDSQEEAESALQQELSDEEEYGDGVSGRWKDGHNEYSDIKNPVARIRFNEINYKGQRLLRVEEIQGPSKENQSRMPSYLRDNIYQLGVKRIISYAKENGFNGVVLSAAPGMTAGETQADRYSLAKHIDALYVRKQGSGLFASGEFTGKYLVETFRQNHSLSKAEYTEQELPGVVGKDLAEKIVRDLQNKTEVEYSGLSLEIGGEGLKKLYDVTLPKLFAAYSGEPTTTMRIPMSNTSIDYDRQRDVWVLKVFDADWKLIDSEHYDTEEEAEVYADELVTASKLPFYPITEKTPGSFPMYSLRGQSTSLPEETKVEYVQRRFQDKWNRFRVITDWLKKQGINLSALADVARSVTNRDGRIVQQLEDFMQFQIQPLVKEAADMKASISDIADYLLMVHTPEANARQRKIHKKADATAAGITDAEAKAKIAEYEARPDFQRFKALAKKWQALSKQTADSLVRAGLLHPDSQKAWEATYQNYVPLRGGDEEAAGRTGTGKGLRGGVKGKLRTGHEIREEHVISNIIKAREQAIKAIENNNVKMSILQYIIEANNAAIGTIAKPVKWTMDKIDDMIPGVAGTDVVTGIPGQKTVVQKKVEAVYYNGRPVGVYTSSAQTDKFIDREVAKGADRSKFTVEITSDPTVKWIAKPMLEDGELDVYVKGHMIRIKLTDELLANAATNMGDEHVNGILGAGRVLNRFLSSVYTGYSPEFAIKNIARDFTAGMINVVGDYGAGVVPKIVANYGYAIKELVASRLDTRKSAMVTRYRKSGGTTGAAWLGDLDRIGGDVEAMYHEAIGAVETYKQVYAEEVANGASPIKARVKAMAKSGIAGFRKVPVMGHFFTLVERINSISENAFRLATFKTLVDMGYSDAKAGEAAKNVTLNFNKRGELGAQMGSVYLFFNPAVQGIHRGLVAVGASEHKRQAQALVGMLAMAGFTLAQLARGGGDEDERNWDMIGQSTKDRNLVISFGGKRYATLPMPYEYSAAVGLGYALSDVLHGKDPQKVAMNVASTIVDAFSPLGNPILESGEVSVLQMMPTAMKLAMGPTMNESGFGQPIMPKSYSEFKPDSQLMWKNTRGSWADFVASKMNEYTGGTDYKGGGLDVSPETLKYWVHGLTGGAGNFLQKAANLPLVIAQGATPEEKELPFVGIVTRELSVMDSRRQFWQAANEAKAAAAEVSAIKKAHDKDAMASLTDADKKMARLAKYADKAAEVAKAKREAIFAVNNDDKLPLSAKREHIKKLEEQEDAVYQKFLDMFEK